MSDGSGASPFRLGARRESRPNDPETTFADLRPTDDSVKYLWAHQAAVLQDYTSNHEAATDVALELPTGMGKTLVGLLIGEYRRRQNDERILYLCPTRQLARQVGRHAESYGIRSVVLVGRQKEYPERAYSSYVRAQAIAVTTYSAVFNVNPRLNDAHVLVLDDAHAGGNFVSDLWSVNIPRDNPAYRPLLELYRYSIPRAVFVRLLDDDVDPHVRNDVYKVQSSALAERQDALVEYLDAFLAEGPRYSWTVVREHLQATHLYVAWGGALIRPLIPPVLRHEAFVQARQRVYMSATLGAGGELERIIGVPEIGRIPVPENWESQRTGRRLILFPDLALPPSDVAETVERVVHGRDRTLILCPTHRRAIETRAWLDTETDAQMLGVDAVEDSLDPFVERTHAALVLAGRYDGIDLPDHSCRQLLMLGLPSALDLQERFFYDKLRAYPVFRDRVRTRITQGIGRCTRNPSDYAAALLCGPDLLQFCLRRESTAGMPRELQAEIEFGIENSDVESVDEFMTLLDAFYAQDEAWAAADEQIREMRQEREQASDELAEALMAVATLEVEYGYALWDGDLERSLELARRISDALSGDALRNYRAWWLYLAASVADRRAAGSADDRSEGAARALFERAVAAADVSWFGSVARLTRVEHEPPANQLGIEAAENVADVLRDLGFAGPGFERAVTELLSQVATDDHETFVRAVETLGQWLGFRTFRPTGDAMPDLIWQLVSGVSIAFEAKPQVDPEQAISVSTARQCVGHEGATRELLDLGDSDPLHVVLLCHHMAIKREAASQAGRTWAVSIADVRTLTDSVSNTLRRVRARSEASTDVVGIVRAEYLASGLDPGRLSERLTAVLARELPQEE